MFGFRIQSQLLTLRRLSKKIRRSFGKEKYSRRRSVMLAESDRKVSERHFFFSSFFEQSRPKVLLSLCLFETLNRFFIRVFFAETSRRRFLKIFVKKKSDISFSGFDFYSQFFLHKNVSEFILTTTILSQTC